MSIDLILLQYDLIQKETFDIATQGFDEDGPHWRLRPLLQSLCWLSTVAKQGQSSQEEKKEDRRKISGHRDQMLLHYSLHEGG